MNKTNKIIQGTYSDYKIVKSRSVAQIIVEIPLETAESFVQMFGMPLPSKEKWVALAMLNERVINKNDDIAFAIQKCGILCKDKRFGKFLQEEKKMHEVNPDDENSIASALKTILGIRSRTELHNQESLLAWNRLLSEYESHLIQD